MEKTPINVLIADDHTLVAKLMNMMLKSSKDINVVGTVSDGREALDFLSKMPVDIVLLDIDMPNQDGMQTLGEIVKKYANTKIIMLSNHSEAWVIQKSLKTGASGYLTKFAESTEVIEAITKVYQGQNYFCKMSFKNLMNKLTNKESDTKTTESQFERLTQREMEILKLIAKELTTKEISEILHISSRTVETHRKNILHKLGAKNTVGLIKTAMDANLIEN